MTASSACAAGPDHAIAVTAHEGRVTVRFNGEIMADTTRAVDLAEAGYPIALYIPLADCRLEHFEPTDHATHCPVKGDARYWTLRANGEAAGNAAWAYENPFDRVARILGHVAFYPNKVTIEAPSHHTLSR